MNQVGIESQQDEHWFEEVFKAINQSIWILDARGKVIKVNPAALQKLNLAQEDIIGTQLWKIPWSILTWQNRVALNRAINQAIRGNPKPIELEIYHRSSPEMILGFNFETIFDETGKLKYIITEGRDLTAYKQTTKALFQSEALFKTVYYEFAIGILIKGVDGKMLVCNPAFQTMLGYSSEELLQLNYVDITHPSDVAASRKSFNELINRKRSSYTIEKRYIHKDGRPVWGRTTASLVLEPNGQPRFVIGMVENIHSQKQIEVELRELQQRLMQGRELERLHLAQDLHDGPLQAVIGLNFQLLTIENNLEKETDREQIINIGNTLRELAKAIRTICSDLRPPTLVPFGLEKTIRSYTDTYQAAHPGLIIHLDLTEDGQKLSEQVRITLFRVYQEALNNILRHAQASTVWVRLSFDDDMAEFEIRDDGIGFEVPNRWIKLARQGHLGLVGTIERVQDIGGFMEISSTPGHGTMICVRTPFKEQLDQPYGEET